MRLGERQRGGEGGAAGVGPGTQPAMQLDGAVAERKDRVIVRETKLLVPNECRPHRFQVVTHVRLVRVC